MTLCLLADHSIHSIVRGPTSSWSKISILFCVKIEFQISGFYSKSIKMFNEIITVQSSEDSISYIKRCSLLFGIFVALFIDLVSCYSYQYQFKDSIIKSLIPVLSQKGIENTKILVDTSLILNLTTGIVYSICIFKKSGQHVLFWFVFNSGFILMMNLKIQSVKYGRWIKVCTSCEIVYCLSGILSFEIASKSVPECDTKIVHIIMMIGTTFFGSLFIRFHVISIYHKFNQVMYFQTALLKQILLCGV